MNLSELFIRRPVLSSVLAACSPGERAALFERAPELAIGERAAICLKLGTVPVPELLDLPESTLSAPEAEQVDLEAFPEHFDHDGLKLEV